MEPIEYVRKQSEIFQSCVDQMIPFLTEMRDSLKNGTKKNAMKARDQEHGQVQGRENEQKISVDVEHLISITDKTIADMSYVVGINRVVLFGNNTDMSKYGVIDGWPGTYWISLQREQSHP